ncbi:MAG: hypothetical protein IJZ75_03345 [Clostridia bacterium]|nr:hypothetical protein [Clostridia bacterium]
MKINLKKLDFRKIFSNKKFTVTISLILSFIIWMVAMVNRNPVRSQTFTDISATVSIENTVASEMGLGIVSDVSSQKFSVTVSGPNYVVSSLKPEDILLSASVTEVNGAGTYSLEIVGMQNSTKSGYTFSSITPDRIDVTFDFIETAEFTVTPKLIGVSATNGLIADNPTVSKPEESTISIKGPRSVIERISSVVAYAEVNEVLNATKSYTADIVLLDKDEKTIYRFTPSGKIYDENGNVVESTSLTLSFTSTTVSQPIVKKATAAVSVVFNNKPQGIKDEDIKYSVDYGKVTVIGTPEVVDKLTSISLSPIDFKNISTTSNSFEVSAILPDGVKLFDNIEFFTVKIDTSDYTEKTFTVSTFKVVNVAGNLTAKTGDSIKNVKICGKESVINKLKAEDIYALVDVSDKSAGQHTVEVVIKSDKYDNIWQVGSYSTAVTLTQK